MANILQAVIREPEPGLYQADYSGEMNGPDEPGCGQLPDRHIATSRNDVKIWVEQMAASLGYDRVEWRDL